MSVTCGPAGSGLPLGVASLCPQLHRGWRRGPGSLLGVTVCPSLRSISLPGHLTEVCVCLCVCVSVCVSVCVCVCLCVCEGRDPGSPVSYPVSPGSWGPEVEGGSEREPRPGAPQKRKPGVQSGRNLLEPSRETWRFWEGGGPASCKLFAAICEVQPLPESAGAQYMLHGVCLHPAPPWVQHPPLLPALPPSIPLGRNTSGHLLIPTKPPTSSHLRT